jgi:hypothetical protein
MFVCSKCQNSFEDAERAGGYRQCRSCRAIYLKEWREAHPGRNAELCRQRAARDPERVKREQAAYRALPGNKEKARERTRAWYYANKARAKAWETENREKRRDQALGRHRTRFGQDPDYAAKCRLETRINQVMYRAGSPISKAYRDEIAAFYAACPPGYEVDHIYPLNGENFCGLHVPWNLQYLTRTENRVKRNALTEVV